MKLLVLIFGMFVALALPALAQQKATGKTVPTKQVPAKQTPTKQTQTKQVATKQIVTKPAASKQVAVKALPPKTVASKQIAAKSAPVKPSVHYTASTTRRPATRSYYQMQPTPDRYKEIQQALADRSYFTGNVDGTWGASSTDALKRFQHDQNLAEEGKIDALSLTALGLGPRRSTTASVTPTPPAVP